MKSQTILVDPSCADGTEKMKRLIVAKYKENMEWLERVPKDWQVTVYDKSNGQLPNVGREPHTFFYAMAEFRRNGVPPTEDIYAFVQGWPFDHCPDFIERLKMPIEGFVPLGVNHHVTQHDGSPAHSGLPVRQKYIEWFEREWPGPIPFCAGGQFAITGKELARYPAEFYERMAKEMEEGQNPWVMERLWAELYKKEEKDSLSDSR